jgi:hypothetical protein
MVVMPGVAIGAWVVHRNSVVECELCCGELVCGIGCRRAGLVGLVSRRGEVVVVRPGLRKVERA